MSSESYNCVYFVCSVIPKLVVPNKLLVCGVRTLTACVECITYVNVLRVLVLSYA